MAVPATPRTAVSRINTFVSKAFGKKPIEYLNYLYDPSTGQAHLTLFGRAFAFASQDRVEADAKEGVHRAALCRDILHTILQTTPAERIEQFDLHRLAVDWQSMATLGPLPSKAVASPAARPAASSANAQQSNAPSTSKISATPSSIQSFRTAQTQNSPSVRSESNTALSPPPPYSVLPHAPSLQQSSLPARPSVSAEQSVAKPLPARAPSMPSTASNAQTAPARAQSQTQTSAASTPSTARPPNTGSALLPSKPLPPTYPKIPAPSTSTVTALPAPPRNGIGLQKDSRPFTNQTPPASPSQVRPDFHNPDEKQAWQSLLRAPNPDSAVERIRWLSEIHLSRCKKPEVYKPYLDYSFDADGRIRLVVARSSNGACEMRLQPDDMYLMNSPQGRDWLKEELARTALAKGILDSFIKKKMPKSTIEKDFRSIVRRYGQLQDLSHNVKPRPLAGPAGLGSNTPKSPMHSHKNGDAVEASKHMPATGAHDTQMSNAQRPWQSFIAPPVFDSQSNPLPTRASASMPSSGASDVKPTPTDPRKRASPPNLVASSSPAANKSPSASNASQSSQPGKNAPASLWAGHTISDLPLQGPSRHSSNAPTSSADRSPNEAVLSKAPRVSNGQDTQQLQDTVMKSKEVQAKEASPTTDHGRRGDHGQMLAKAPTVPSLQKIQTAATFSAGPIDSSFSKAQPLLSGQIAPAELDPAVPKAPKALLEGDSLPVAIAPGTVRTAQPQPDTTKPSSLLDRMKSEAAERSSLLERLQAERAAVTSLQATSSGANTPTSAQPSPAQVGGASLLDRMSDREAELRRRIGALRKTPLPDGTDANKGMDVDMRVESETPGTAKEQASVANAGDIAVGDSPQYRATPGPSGSVSLSKQASPIAPNTTLATGVQFESSMSPSLLPNERQDQSMKASETAQAATDNVNITLKKADESAKEVIGRSSNSHEAERPLTEGSGVQSTTSIIDAPTAPSNVVTGSKGTTLAPEEASSALEDQAARRTGIALERSMSLSSAASTTQETLQDAQTTQSIRAPLAARSEVGASESVLRPETSRNQQAPSEDVLGPKRRRDSLPDSVASSSRRTNVEDMEGKRRRMESPSAYSVGSRDVASRMNDRSDTHTGSRPKDLYSKMIEMTAILSRCAKGTLTYDEACESLYSLQLPPAMDSGAFDALEAVWGGSTAQLFQKASQDFGTTDLVLMPKTWVEESLELLQAAGSAS